MIKFHISFSILCMVTFFGFGLAYGEKIKENGWTKQSGMKKPQYLLFFFVPILNVLLTLFIFVMISYTEKEFDEFINLKTKQINYCPICGRDLRGL